MYTVREDSQKAYKQELLLQKSSCAAVALAGFDVDVFPEEAERGAPSEERRRGARPSLEKEPASNRRPAICHSRSQFESDSGSRVRYRECSQEPHGTKCSSRKELSKSPIKDLKRD